MKTHILKRPVITEKSMFDASRNIYTFEVDLKATKSQIKTLVTQLFDVHVLKITTSIRKPATKKTGRRRLPSPVSPTKLAKIWLKEGETIDLFEFKES